MNPTLQSLQVIDDAGYPLSQATVAILNASNEIIGGEATDTAGYVILKLNVDAKSIRISYIGYQHVELSRDKIGDEPIELSPLSSNLPEATVKAYRGSVMKGGFSSGGTFITHTKKTQQQKFDSIPKSKVNLFPNPSTGQSKLKSNLLKDARLVNVYSSTGQLVQSIPMHTNPNDQLPVTLPQRYGSGTYIIELVMASGFTEVTKWLVVR